MRPLTATQLTQRLFDTVDAIRANVRSTASLGTISMMLVLKRASDQPGTLHVPSWMQWPQITSIPGAREPGRQLYEAMKELEQSNPDVLDGVLEGIGFPAELGRTEVEILINSFSQVWLSDENLEFTDTVGDAYDGFLDRMVGMITRRDNEHNTPRPLAELMVRLIQPEPGQSIYDPFAGTAGMLIKASEYAREQGIGNVEIYGQELDHYQWAAAKLNLLLHGVPNSQLLHVDSLNDPGPVTIDGTLTHFDRVLARPPLGRSYQRKRVRYPERMTYGWAPEHGRADLMYVQHALAVLSPDGMGAIITPQGVLFRSGAEAEIRRGIVEDGRIKAVISLGPNVFQATSIPACILVLQGIDQQDSQDRSVLFIDAEQEMVTGRAQRRLEPKAVEKIVDVLNACQGLPGFSRVVSLEEIADNGFNLSVRRYVEAGLPAHLPPDARAILSGGVPRREVEEQADRFRTFGIDPASLFQVKDASYVDFPPGGYEATAARIPDLTAAREQEFNALCQMWWAATAEDIAELAATNRLLRSRSELIASFRAQLSPMGILDVYQLSGAFAAWWTAWHDDLRILDQSGFQTVINRWDAVTTDWIYRIPEREARERVLARLGADLCVGTQAQVAGERQKLADIYRSWGERYATSLASLEAERDAAAASLGSRLQHLGY